MAPYATAEAQSLPSAYKKAFRHDAGGRLMGTISAPPASTVNANFLASRNHYDAFGRLERVETGSLPTWQGEDVTPEKWLGFQISTTTTYTYDAFGRQVRVKITGTDGASTVTDTSYDTSGRVLCVAVRLDPASLGAAADACTLQTAKGAENPDRITRTTYDKLNRPTIIERAYATTDAQKYVSYSYTATGKKEVVTDANGNRTKFHYNGFDQLDTWYFHSKVLEDGREIFDDYELYAYDSVGNRTSLLKRDGVLIEYVYDALNRVIKKNVPTSASGASGYVVFYDYDLTGQQVYARFGSTSGYGVTNTYDGFGRLEKSTVTSQGASRSVSAEFDANGNRTQVTTPFGTWSYRYDGLDRLTQLFEGTDTTNAKAKMSTWTYNTFGQLENVTERPGSGTSWTYDGIGRLHEQSDAFPGGSGNLTNTLSYNSAGQIVESKISNSNYSFDGYYNVTRKYKSNSLNQYSVSGSNSLGYDANGNLSRVNKADGDPTYVYDAENRLVQAGSVKLSYDPLGRLFQVASDQSGQTQFLYDGDQLVAEFDGAGLLTHAYVHGPGQDDPLLWYPGNDSVRWLHRNYLGSIIATASAQSSGVDRVNSYDQYGIPGNSNVGRFQYTGQAWIPELGLYHYKARLYSPTLGRFLQTDPIGYDDQVNLYAYVANDPVNGRDPTGRDGQWVYNRTTGQTTLRIPVYYHGAGATPEAVANIERRVESLNIPNANYKIDVVVLSSPGGRGTNSLDLSPGEDRQAYPTAGEGINRLGGNVGHINSSNSDYTSASAHDTLHFVGIRDRYVEGSANADGSRGPSSPAPGYTDSNIMTSRQGTELNNSQFEEARRNSSTKRCTVTGDTTTC